ncbi:MAG: 5-formyltetrahydrofolate cyclo-ligase [Kiritimatiellae bacterium]|nr:5-formyltetrahydrofolate cyclo-ligase [Kiritimatiellia bacterium]
MVGSVSEAKRALRREARALRVAHAGDASVSFLPALSALPAWPAARIVALYLPCGPWEPPTADISAAALAAGKKVCAPVWLPDRGCYGLAALGSGVPLRAGPMDVPEPDGGAPVPLDAPDLFLVPGLFFDSAGRRLGHGKGWIDRLLAGRRPGSAVVGLAFPWQISAAPLPSEPHDAAMDAVLLPDGPAAPPLAPRFQ